MNFPEQEFLDALTGNVKPGDCFFFLGMDSYWMDRYSQKIRQELRKIEDAELVILYGDEIKAGELMDQLDSFSIFSSLRLVIIKSADAMKKRELEILTAYFDSPSETQTLIVQAEKVDARLATWKKIKASSRFAACDNPRWASQVKLLLQQELKQRGKSMDARAMEGFITRVELDYATAINELDKLLLIAPDKKSFTEADVQKSLSGSRLGALTDFHRALGRKQAAEAVSTANKMLESDWEALQVLYQIQKLFMSIWKIAILKAKHMSNNEIIQSHLNELYLSQRKEYVEFASNYSLKSIEKVFSALLELDSQLKSINTDPKLLLTITLNQICMS